MTVSVELFGQLSPRLPRHQTLNWTPRMTVQKAASLLGLNLEEIGLITINGMQGEVEDALPPDCRLCFFPPMSGG